MVSAQESLVHLQIRIRYLLSGVLPNLTSDGESMEAHHSDDSGFESGGEEAIPVLTANVPSQLPPPQRPNTPSKAPQRPTTLALNTSPPSSNQGKCIWCLTVRSLLPGKRLCAECSAQGCECAYCHRPMPERFSRSPNGCVMLASRKTLNKRQNVEADLRKNTKHYSLQWRLWDATCGSV